MLPGPVGQVSVPTSWESPVRTLATALRKAVRFAKGHRQSDLVYPVDQIGEGGRKQLIPLTVYQTAESPGVHPLLGKSIQQFRSLNKDLSFVFFDRGARDVYMEEQWSNHPIFDVYRRARFGQMQADIFRYCIVYQRGGYYFDYNKGCGVPLTSLHEPDAEGLITAEPSQVLVFPEKTVAKKLLHPTHTFGQWAFAFTAGHPILLNAINRIVEIEPFVRNQVFHVPKDGVLILSATGLFTDVVRAYLSRNNNGLTQAGINFHGTAIFRLRGSKIALKDSSHYSKLRNQRILHPKQVVL